jgi:hypothetical protein
MLWKLHADVHSHRLYKKGDIEVVVVEVAW